MNKRRSSIDEDELRARRSAFYETIAAAEPTHQKAVKRMRALSGLTQQEFADHYGISIKVIKDIKDIERGVGNPTVHTLNQIAGILGLEVSFIRRPVRSPSKETSD